MYDEEVTTYKFQQGVTWWISKCI